MSEETPNTGDITPSNKSSQTVQKNAQNFPNSEPNGSAKRIISEKGPTRSNGKLGKGF